jgi:hypothetical protein
MGLGIAMGVEGLLSPLFTSPFAAGGLICAMGLVSPRFVVEDGGVDGDGEVPPCVFVLAGWHLQSRNVPVLLMVELTSV